MKAGLRLLWVLACAAVIGGLAGELALRARRAGALREARRYRQANVFEAAREVAAGGGEGVWLQPGVRYRPGARLRLEAGGETYEIRINSLGYRSDEFSPGKPPGSFRVACIGGSTTVQGRTNDETYPALLQADLRRRHPERPIEVLNLGINGTQSDYWLERLDQLFGYEPDVVLHYELVNDLFFGHLRRFAAEHPWRVRLERSLLLARVAPLDPAALEPSLAPTLRRFRALHGAAKARGARYVAATFAAPDPGRVDPSFGRYLDLNVEAWSRGVGLRDYDGYHRLLLGHNARLRAFAAENGLPVAPVAEQLRDPALFVDICHMTPSGIAGLAAAFLPEVERAYNSGP